MSGADPFTESRGYDAFYGLELLELSPTGARAARRQEDHKQPFGIVHGGIYAAIAEGLASYQRSRSSCPGQARKRNVESASFLRPMSGGTIHATRCASTRAARPGCGRLKCATIRVGYVRCRG